MKHKFTSVLWNSEAPCHVSKGLKGLKMDTKRRGKKFRSLVLRFFVCVISWSCQEWYHISSCMTRHLHEVWCVWYLRNTVENVIGICNKTIENKNLCLHWYIGLCNLRDYEKLIKLINIYIFFFWKTSESFFEHTFFNSTIISQIDKFWI